MVYIVAILTALSVGEALAIANIYHKLNKCDLRPKLDDTELYRMFNGKKGVK